MGQFSVEIYALPGSLLSGNQQCVYAKRLERGKFVWPRAHEGALRLSAAQLAMLVEGLNWKQAIVHDAVITPRLA